MPWLSLALVATAVAIRALPGQGAGLDWQPGAEGWRLLTCQLTHWDADHLLWDALAVAILGCWSESRWPEVTRRALLIGLVLIPAVVVVAYPGMAFRGLSGLACTLAVTGALGAWREARHAHDRLAMGVAGALLVGLAAKTVYELLTHDAVFAAATTWQPVPLAHLVGILGGSSTSSTKGHWRRWSTNAGPASHGRAGARPSVRPTAHGTCGVEVPTEAKAFRPRIRTLLRGREAGWEAG